MSVSDESEGLSDNTQVKANLAFMVKTIALVGTAVWGYSVIWNKIIAVENDIIRMQHEVHMNTEFRVKWPRGELGSLPADAEQNMRLNHMEGRFDKVESHVDKLRLGGIHQ